MNKKIVFTSLLLFLICGLVCQKSVAQCVIKTEKKPDGGLVRTMSPVTITTAPGVVYNLGASTDMANYFLGFKVDFEASGRDVIGPMFIELENGYVLEFPLTDSRVADMGNKDRLFAAYLIPKPEVVILSLSEMKKVSFEYLDGEKVTLEVQFNRYQFLCGK